MTTALITHAACIEHRTPPGHPERSERLESVLAALNADEFASLARYEAPKATEEELVRVHDGGYVREVLAAVPTTGYVQFDGDTYGSPGTGEAVLRAAGEVRAANFVPVSRSNGSLDSLSEQELQKVLASLNGEG